MPPVPAAGDRGSLSFSAGFTSTFISGTPAGGTFTWTVVRRRMSKRLLEAGLVLGSSKRLLEAGLVLVAGARGSDCFSMDFRTAEIQGLRFSDFGAVVILASSDGTVADGHVWGCFLAIDFSRMPG